MSRVGWLALLVAVAAVAYWAGTNAILPPQLPAVPQPHVTYEVTTGTVGRSVRVPVAASWPVAQTLPSRVDGVVTTELIDDGGVATTGAVVATVDLRPLVVAEGVVPMFRTLHEGLAGPDVLQLQTLLRARGLLDGAREGTFDAVTAQATMRWQRSIGAEVTGQVDPGDLIFIAAMPARLDLVPQVGDRVSDGDPLVRVLAADPAFVITVGASQRAELSSGMDVSIAAPGGGDWRGELGVFRALEDGRYVGDVTGSPCGVDCGRISTDGDPAPSRSCPRSPAWSCPPRVWSRSRRVRSRWCCRTGPRRA
jgi:peptidoglycan hydrolase-like protein with peptidoglycan-binding domain